MEFIAVISSNNTLPFKAILGVLFPPYKYSDCILLFFMDSHVALIEIPL